MSAREAAEFETFRPRLFSLAYRLLGSAKGAAEVGVAIGEVNGQPALYGAAQGRLLGVMVLEVTDGLVSAVRSVANPDKLVHMAARLRTQAPSTVSR
ncbi:hypothetical protein GCM10010404_85660 [Nonomuraea africana]|uniref:Uncharacterized protein n=1 Tax=Nonomuraea africana TaxID=46171 RepID=A0ABR9K8B0_9ACTN|nr:hypothetical protein [Nonomuraea africana]MBE1558245.1 hypothetical protein [Nonomuraea africana]